MKEVKFKFIKKDREVKMYNKIRRQLIKNGLKPLDNITYTFSFDCKSKRPKRYPYTITINYDSNKHYKLVA